MRNYLTGIVSSIADEAKNNSPKHLFFTALYFLALSIALRLPFFFTDVLDWDESSYILMGQSMLDGFMSDRDYWLVRAYPYALFIKIFGDSIASIRFAGAVCVALTAFFTCIIGKQLWGLQIGIVAGSLSVILLSLLPDGQPTMSEHIALVPLTGALALLVTKTQTPRILFFVGALISTACLVRLNLAYVAIIIGFFAVLLKSSYPISGYLQRGIAYSIGGFLVLSLSYLPYVVVGQHYLWWTNNFLAGLSYAESQLSVWEAIGKQATYIFRTLTNFEGMVFGAHFILWIGGLAGILLDIFQRIRGSDDIRYRFIALYLFLIGVSVSIVKSGAAYPHYLMQVVPFMSLFSAYFIIYLMRTRLQLQVLLAVSLLLLISMKPILAHYKYRISHYVEHGSLYSGPAFEIAPYLKKENPDKEPVYIMKRHIVYWLLDSYPMTTSTVHPSNIAKDYLLEHIVGPGATTETELTKIFNQNPKFVVKTKSVWYLDKKPKAKILLDDLLLEKYELVKQVQGLEIYRRVVPPENNRDWK